MRGILAEDQRQLGATGSRPDANAVRSQDVTDPWQLRQTEQVAYLYALAVISNPSRLNSARKTSPTFLTPPRFWVALSMLTTRSRNSIGSSRRSSTTFAMRRSSGVNPWAYAAAGIVATRNAKRRPRVGETGRRLMAVR